MQMGVYGAALATILGLILSFGMGIYYFKHKRKSISFTLYGLSAREALHCMVNGASEFVDQLAVPAAETLTLPVSVWFLRPLRKKNG